MRRFIKKAKRCICVSLIGAFVLGTAAQAADLSEVPVDNIQETQNPLEENTDISTPADASLSEEMLQGEVEEDCTETSLEDVELMEASTEEIEDLSGLEIEAGVGTTVDTAEEVGFGSYVAVISTEGKGYFYKFTPEIDCQLYIYSDCVYKSCCYLYNSNKERLDYRKGGWIDSNFCLIYPVEAGETYYIQIKFASTTRTGNVPVFFDKIILDGKDGWHYGLDHWLYVKNGAIIHKDWAKINNKWYYFDDAGFMVRAEYRYQIDDEVYGFDNEGRMLSGWVKSIDGWHYYRSNGTAPNGITKIGNDKYKFDNGLMQTNLWYTSEDKFIWHFGENGKLESKVKEVANGWNDKNGKRYYYENSKAVTSAWRKIGGKWYYFNASGVMLTGLCNVTDSATNEVSTYAFDKNGAMVTGWFNYNGKWYYFDKNGEQLKGLQTIGNGVYYFNTYGRMLTNYDRVANGVHYYFGTDGEAIQEASKEGWNKFYGNWYYQQDGKLYKDKLIQIGQYTYYFDSNGRMVENTPVALYGDAYRCFDENGRMICGWKKNGGDWMYFDKTGAAVDGIQKIDNEKYYFISRVLQTNKVYIKGLNAYYFGANGKLQDQLAFKAGWNKFHGNWYYVNNNVVLVNDIFRDTDGQKYGFNGAGEMVKNTEYVFESGTYRFDAQGRMVHGWYDNLEGGRSYYSENGTKAKNGVYKIDGKTYLFDYDGCLRRSCTELVGFKIYNVDEKGEATEYYAGTDGWVSYLYYVENGELVRGWKKIDDYWYYFDEKGKKLYNEKSKIENITYGFDTSGRMIIGWGNIWGSIVYADKSGALIASGWQEIDGKRYYFESHLVLTGLQLINGTYQTFDKSGVWLGSFSGVSKFVTCGGNTYYFDKTGALVHGTVKIGGYEYYFGNDGVMYRNQKNGDKYYCSNGRLAINKWIEAEPGVWNYYGSSGTMIKNQWFIDDTKIYYFDSYGRMCTGVKTIDGSVYKFGMNGVWDGKSYRTGWKKIDNCWYYMIGGKTITGWVKIDDEWYYLTDNKMLYNSVKTFGKKKVYIGWDGTIARNGWYKIPMNMDKYACEYKYGYADAQGYLVDGLQTINGNKYYFVNNSMVDYSTVDTTHKYFYEIGSNGIIKNTYTADGTGFKTTTSGDKLYSLNGKFVSGYQLIDGKAYMFDNGIMAINTYYENYGYFGANGVLEKHDTWTKPENNMSPSVDIAYYAGTYYAVSGNTKIQLNFKDGWNEYKGKWYYLQDENLAEGIIKINGDWYDFNMSTKQMYVDTLVNTIAFDAYYAGPDGKFVANKWVKSESGDWYYIGSDKKTVIGINVIDGKKYYFNSYRVLME